MNIINNKSILTPTSGFLANGYTHSLNPYSGCSFANAICGTYCYVQHNRWVTKGRKWELYGSKQNTKDLYIKEYKRIKNIRKGNPKPLKIYMSSSTDPYIPQEKKLKSTQSLLEAMTQYPPDVLVLQTRNPLVERDFELIKTISTQAEVWLSVTVETDMEKISNFPNHATSPKRRMETLRLFKEHGILTQATISPLMPIKDLEKFSKDLNHVCTRVILDHYLLGDGSKNGSRTHKTPFPQMLTDAGFEEWNSLDKFWEVVSSMKAELGDNRVLISSEGFNKVGQK